MTVAPVIPTTELALIGSDIGPFQTSFPFEQPSDVQLWLQIADTGTPTFLVLNYDYTMLAPTPLTNGGQATLSAAWLADTPWPNGSSLLMLRVTSSGQPTALGDQTGFQPSTYEAGLDHLARQIQDLGGGGEGGSGLDQRTLRGEPGEMFADLPGPAERAFGGEGSVLGFDGVAGLPAIYSKADFIGPPGPPGDVVNGASLLPPVGSFGYVDPTNTFDSSPGFVEALASGLDFFIPDGHYRIDQQISSSATAQGQIVQGAGRASSVLHINAATFNMSALGVFNVVTPETNYLSQGPVIFNDFGIIFAQPDTNVRANLNVYPPAFRVNDAGRCQWNRIRITAGTVGINLIGQCGGASINLLESSCFLRNVEIDGCADTVRLTDFQCWPFGLTANQMEIFEEPFSFPNSTFALFCGRCDDLAVRGGLIFCGGGVYLYTSTNPTLPGPTTGMFSDTGFDSQAALFMDGGTVAFSNCYWTTSNANVQLIYLNNGTATFGNCIVEAGIQLAGSGACIVIAGGDMVWNGGHFELAGADNRCFLLSSAPGSLTLSGALFKRQGGLSYTQNKATVYQTAGVLTMTGCRQSPVTAGWLAEIATNDKHVVVGNSAAGAIIQSPATPVGIYANNAAP